MRIPLPHHKPNRVAVTWMERGLSQVGEFDKMGKKQRTPLQQHKPHRRHWEQQSKLEEIKIYRVS